MPSSRTILFLLLGTSGTLAAPFFDGLDGEKHRGSHLSKRDFPGSDWGGYRREGGLRGNGERDYGVGVGNGPPGRPWAYGWEKPWDNKEGNPGDWERWENKGGKPWDRDNGGNRPGRGWEGYKKSDKPRERDDDASHWDHIREGYKKPWSYDNGASRWGHSEDDKKPWGYDNGANRWGRGEDKDGKPWGFDNGSDRWSHAGEDYKKPWGHADDVERWNRGGEDYKKPWGYDNGMDRWGYGEEGNKGGEKLGGYNNGADRWSQDEYYKNNAKPWDRDNDAGRDKKNEKPSGHDENKWDGKQWDGKQWDGKQWDGKQWDGKPSGFGLNPNQLLNNPLDIPIAGPLAKQSLALPASLLSLVPPLLPLDSKRDTNTRRSKGAKRSF